ncbi:nuclear transport factor 2 family protein [Amycolatopsis sp. NPDC005232]|uniref:nuclear transport factor 2 family protein n=1 Tax=Amycolatopsis sp. NPDC005232 TaxID=3157027 RepID=UPI0033A2502D
MAHERGEDIDESLDARIAWLEAFEELKRLKARYFRYVDTHDWTGLRALFTDDCEFGGDNLREVTGPDDFVNRVQAWILPGTSVHRGADPVLTIRSRGTASGVWPMYDRVEIERPGGSRGWEGYGYYHETYRRGADDMWRIAAWRLERLNVWPLR